MAPVPIPLCHARRGDSGRATSLSVPRFPRLPQSPRRAQVRQTSRENLPPAATAPEAPDPGRKGLPSVEAPEHFGACGPGLHPVKSPRCAFLGSRSPLPAPPRALPAHISCVTNSLSKNGLSSTAVPGTSLLDPSYSWLVFYGGGVHVIKQDIREYRSQSAPGVMQPPPLPTSRICSSPQKETPGPPSGGCLLWTEWCPPPPHSHVKSPLQCDCPDGPSWT